MGLGSLGVCVILIVCAGWCQTEAATVTATSTPGIKGTTGHNVTCQFSGLNAGESFYAMQIYRTGNPTYIVSMINVNSAPLWNTAGADDALRNRANLTSSPASQSVTIMFKETRCEDNGREYKCELILITSGSLVTQTPDFTQVQVEAAPLRPNAMQVLPSSVNSSVPEYTVLTFRCEGNVGLLAGSFQWYTFVGIEYTNVTNDAIEISSTPGTGDDSCTTVKVSRYVYNATRTPYGRNLVVRCRVYQYHATQGSNNDPMDCGVNNTFCRMSQQISVHYPVKVSVSPPRSSSIEGQSVTLMCSMDSNPLAEGTRWYKDDMSNETLSNITTLTLQNLSLSDAGVYTCISFNKVGSITFNSTATSTLAVSRKPPPTTQAPTTTPSPTTTGSNGNGGGNGGGTSDAAKAGLTDDEVTIIVVVVVVGVVLIIAVIVIVICVRKRRSRKEVEEPPEKPFNNHAGINTLATRPDLVINDKAYPNAYNNAFKNEDGLTYAELQFDNKPRSRRPLALDDTNTDYSDVSMPQV